MVQQFCIRFKTLWSTLTSIYNFIQIYSGDNVMKAVWCSSVEFPVDLSFLFWLKKSKNKSFLSGYSSFEKFSRSGFGSGFNIVWFSGFKTLIGSDWVHFQFMAPQWNYNTLQDSLELSLSFKSCITNRVGCFVVKTETWKIDWIWIKFDFI